VQRITATNDQLAAYGAATTAAARETAIDRATERLLGADFRLIPEFTLLGKQADELQRAYDERANLLTHVRTVEGVDFPVDTWLYGVARVRPRMGSWEGITLLAEAMEMAAPELEPVQLPYANGASWLAMPFPTVTSVDQDHLLYTAYWSTPFVKTTRQCGVLLDEWTEVIPRPEETTGVAFHFDRPNAEPPQVMLLVAPPAITGAWDWTDLVDTLRETLALTKRRAVEPDHIDAATYARFLPATISAVTYHPISIALDLAVNNEVFALVEDGGNNG
jgi:hypothetical protein